ncbi:MAG: WG repeat-containing protein [Sediminibacterium sp.]|nr:WG repeat-containing protein [Sediminibacterium sp.]
MNRLLILLAFIPFAVKGATDTIRVVDTTALRQLYGVILQKKPTSDTGSFRWEHRRIIYKALGIDAADVNDVATAERLRLGWQQLQTVRISQASEPVFYFSQVLRLALHHGYGPLLLDAVRWKVDVNSFDPVSHSSLLDYLEEEYRNNTEENRFGWLREYKQVLQAGGAVYFEETNFKMRNLAKKYDRIRPPVDGLYPVMIKSKWGWVNANNKVVVPLKYKAVRNFTGELFEVSDDGIHFRVINKILGLTK